MLEPTEKLIAETILDQCFSSASVTWGSTILNIFKPNIGKILVLSASAHQVFISMFFERLEKFLDTGKSLVGSSAEVPKEKKISAKNDVEKIVSATIDLVEILWLKISGYEKGEEQAWMRRCSLLLRLYLVYEEYGSLNLELCKSFRKNFETLFFGYVMTPAIWEISQMGWENNKAAKELILLIHKADLFKAHNLFCTYTKQNLTILDYLFATPDFFCHAAAIFTNVALPMEKGEASADHFSKLIEVLKRNHKIVLSNTCVLGAEHHAFVKFFSILQNVPQSRLNWMMKRKIMDFLNTIIEPDSISLIYNLARTKEGRKLLLWLCHNNYVTAKALSTPISVSNPKLCMSALQLLAAKFPNDAIRIFTAFNFWDEIPFEHLIKNYGVNNKASLAGFLFNLRQDQFSQLNFSRVKVEKLHQWRLDKTELEHSELSEFKEHKNKRRKRGDFLGEVKPFSKEQRVENWKFCLEQLKTKEKFFEEWEPRFDQIIRHLNEAEYNWMGVMWGSVEASFVKKLLDLCEKKDGYHCRAIVEEPQKHTAALQEMHSTLMQISERTTKKPICKSLLKIIEDLLEFTNLGGIPSPELYTQSISPGSSFTKTVLAT